MVPLLIRSKFIGTVCACPSKVHWQDLEAGTEGDGREDGRRGRKRRRLSPLHRNSQLPFWLYSNYAPIGGMAEICPHGSSGGNVICYRLQGKRKKAPEWHHAYIYSRALCTNEQMNVQGGEEKLAYDHGTRVFVGWFNDWQGGGWLKNTENVPWILRALNSEPFIHCSKTHEEDELGLVDIVSRTIDRMMRSAMLHEARLCNSIHVHRFWCCWANWQLAFLWEWPRR